MTSGESAASSAACLRVSMSSPDAERKVDLQVATVGPTELLELFQKCHPPSPQQRVAPGRAV